MIKLENESIKNRDTPCEQSCHGPKEDVLISDTISSRFFGSGHVGTFSTLAYSQHVKLCNVLLNKLNRVVLFLLQMKMENLVTVHLIKTLHR